LKNVIEVAEKGSGIEISISTLRGEYGILIKKNTKAEWLTGQLILPVAIESYTVKNVTESCGFMAGWSTSKILDSAYSHSRFGHIVRPQSSLSNTHPVPIGTARFCTTMDM